EAVGLGQRVEAGEHVREAQQAHRAGEEESATCENQHDGDRIADHGRCSLSAPMSSTRRTNANTVSIASTAKIRATSNPAGCSKAVLRSRTIAMPVVLNSWAASM